MKCQLLVSTKEGQELACTLVLRNGKISAKPEKGYEMLAESVLTDSHFFEGEYISRRADPGKWFKALPYQYRGSYLRAILVQESGT
jgi:hypothetical protein